MIKSKRIFWRAVQPLVGSVIGVGIFGLPFVFAQSGFGIGIAHLVVIAIFNTVLLLAFADIIKNSEGHPRITGVMERYLGKGWAWVATLISFSASWGAIVAYIIIGGEFLHALVSPLIGGGVMTYQIIFYAVSAILVIGGLGFISRLEVVFVFTMMIMLLLIVLGSAPHVEFEQLTYVDSSQWFLPFGALLFAFGGLAAIPEMSQVLGKYKEKYLNKAIVTGFIIVSMVYLIFIAIVVGVSGVNTTNEAIVGLGDVVGNWVLVIGSVVGLFSVFTSFLILSVSVMDTLIYDFKRRHLVGWFIAVSVPLIVFLLGARSFIHVIGFTGGILGGSMGILVIYMYFKAKKHVCTPKRCLVLPNWLLYLSALVFLSGIVMTVISVSQ